MAPVRSPADPNPATEHSKSNGKKAGDVASKSRASRIGTDRAGRDSDKDRRDSDKDRRDSDKASGDGDNGQENSGKGRSDTHKAGGDSVSDSRYGDRYAHKDRSDSGGKDGIAGASAGQKGVTVPCDADFLVLAIQGAIAQGGGTLDLAKRCVYSLDAPDFNGTDGLPPITQPITINGHYATIQRIASAEQFRIFDVGVGGRLTIRDLTVKGGDVQGLDGPGGSGMLVQTGGEAIIQHSRFLTNRSDEGGAIANYGVTHIVESADGEDSGDGSVADDRAAGDSTEDDSAADDSAEDDSTGDDSTGDDAADDSTPSGKQSDAESTDSGKSGSDRGSVIGAGAAGVGGAIFNGGFLTATHGRLTYNQASVAGAGLGNSGIALLRGCLVDHNHSTNFGGGIESFDGALTSLDDCVVTGNTSGFNGGGIDNTDSQVYLHGTTVSHNQAAPNGGGIENEGTLVADDSWIAGNAATGSGGGIRNSGSGSVVVLRNSHVDRNQTLDPNSVGGGISNSNGSVRIVGTKVTRNVSGQPAGGIDTEDPARVSVDDDSAVVKNQPTNCTPGVANCVN